MDGRPQRSSTRDHRGTARLCQSQRRGAERAAVAPCPDSPGGGGSREHAATSLLQPLPPSLRPSGLSGPPGGSNDPTVAIFNWGPVCCHVFVFCSLSCKILNSTTFKRNPAPLLTLPKTDKSPRKVR